MSTPADRPLSAMALGTYQGCPLRYRYRYLDGLYWPATLGSSREDRQALDRGLAFHLMARRYYAGVEPAHVADPVEQRELEGWLHLLQGFLPRTLDEAFYPELELRLNRPDFRLMAKFDLLVVPPDGRAVIYDWKTEKRMPRGTYLRLAPQTLVYRYLLCAAGGAYSPFGRFRPDQVAMVYWNPQFPHRWERFDYSDAQFESDEEHLRTLFQQIHATPRAGFAATTEERVCSRCEYNMICHGRKAEGSDWLEEDGLDAADLAWDTLPELP